MDNVFIMDSPSVYNFGAMTFGPGGVVGLVVPQAGASTTKHKTAFSFPTHSAFSSSSGTTRSRPYRRDVRSAAAVPLPHALDEVAPGNPDDLNGVAFLDGVAVENIRAALEVEMVDGSCVDPARAES